MAKFDLIRKVIAYTAIQYDYDSADYFNHFEKEINNGDDYFYITLLLEQIAEKAKEAGEPFPNIPDLFTMSGREYTNLTSVLTEEEKSHPFDLKKIELFLENYPILQEKTRKTFDDYSAAADCFDIYVADEIFLIDPQEFLEDYIAEIADDLCKNSIEDKRDIERHLQETAIISAAKKILENGELLLAKQDNELIPVFGFYMNDKEEVLDADALAALLNKEVKGETIELDTGYHQSTTHYSQMSYDEYENQWSTGEFCVNNYLSGDELMGYIEEGFHKMADQIRTHIKEDAIKISPITEYDFSYE